MKKQERELKGVQRDIDKDLRDLEKQEKQLTADIQKAAKAGNTSLAKTLAKQLIQIRNQKERNYSVKSKVTGVSMATKSSMSQQKLATSMASTAKIMGTVNMQTDISKLQATMQEFQKQSFQMEMKEDLMNDTMDDVMGEDEGLEDEILDQVFDEIGIEVGASMASTPRNKLSSKSQEKESDDIQNLLASLK